MIVLDTNVLSTVMREAADTEVVRWLDGVPKESLWTTTITVFEIRFGLETMASGRRRRQLEQAFVQVLEIDLDGRILEFDRTAAEAAATMAAERQQSGRPIDIRDAQIAGIAKVRKATLATRNSRDFQGLGVPLVDPWNA
jgi:hypothetical protein